MIRVNVKDTTKRVKRAVNNGMKRTLPACGAWVRGVARRSISKKKKPSLPGKPPHSPTGRLRASIVFEVDKAAGSVAIGPARSVLALIGRTHEFGGIEAPKVSSRKRRRFDLRVGGVGPINQVGKKLVVVRLKSEQQVGRARALVAQLPEAQGGNGSRKIRRYPPRPFMAPAMKRARERIPSFFKDMMRGG